MMTPLQKQWAKDIFSIGARSTLAFTFIAACIHKIADPSDFALQVATYQILPLSLVNFQAVALPFVELTAGILLIVGFWTRPAALITVGMNIMFIAAVAMALKADLQLQCGCFASSGAGEEMSLELIFRDAAFMIIAALLIFLGPDRLTIDNLIIKRRISHA
jgi:putative oxidoreductase